MPDVGILNLQIHDDSAKAAEGLSKLVAKLEEMKDATSKIRLGTVATGIKRINDELSKVQPSAIYKLKQLADVLEKIGSISGNVGGIRISFGGRGQSAEDMAAQLQAARDAVAQTTAGFEQIGQRIQEDAQGAETFAGAIGRVNEIVQQTGWTAQTTADQFSRMFQMMNSMRMSRALGEGANPFALGDGTGGSGADWTYWKDGAIEVEGYVDDISTSMNRLEGSVDGVSAKLYSSTSESVGSAMEQIKMLAMQYEAEIGRLSGLMFDETGATRVGADIEGLSRQIDDYDNRISELAEKYKELESISEMSDMAEPFAQTSEAVDEVRESFERTTSAVQDYNEAIEFARKWNASGASASAYKGQEAADIEYVNNLIQSASQADLLTMRIDALRDKLYQMAGSGKYTGDQIARMVSQIQNLQAKLDGLGYTADDVKKSFSGITAGARGLDGAFKRMFPTISGLLSRFKQIVKYRMLRAVIKQIADGFKEGAENYYWYSKAIGGEFATKMDNAATALLQMKNSIGAAAAPLINSLIPYLKMAVDWFIEVVNWANQFISLLRGQQTWTRAIPKSAQAFEDTTKAAKGTSKAMKDLLADWDELNIIQSNSGSGTGGAGTAVATDYLDMFEEVATFDQGVRDTVKWIQDNFDDILKVVEAIGATILAWKISKAFGGSLNALKTLELAAGILLVIDGIEVVSSAGYDAGKNGINTDNLMQALWGGLKTTLGGGLIGLAIGGAAGGLIGLTLGAIASLVIYEWNFNEGKMDSLYGEVSLTADEITDEVNKLFTIDPTVTLNNATVDHNSLEAARTQVATDLHNLGADYVTFKLNTTPETAKELKAKVDKLVDDTNQLISLGKKTISLGFGFESSYLDESTLAQAFSLQHMSGLSEIITNLGNEIGKLLTQGILDEVDGELLDGMIRELMDVSSAIATGRAAAEFEADVSKGYSHVSDWSALDRDTLTAYSNQYGSSVDKVREAAYINARDTRAWLGSQYFGMLKEEEYHPGTYTPEELAYAKKLYEEYDIDKSVEDFVFSATELGREKFIENMSSSFFSIIKKKGSDWGDLQHVSQKAISGGETLGDWINGIVAGEIGWSKADFSSAMENMGMTGWDFMPYQMRQKYLPLILKELGQSRETYTRMKTELGINVEDLIDVTGWEEWGWMERENFIDTLTDIFGEDAVYAALQAKGYDVLDIGDPELDRIFRRSDIRYKPRSERSILDDTLGTGFDITDTELEMVPEIESDIGTISMPVEIEVDPHFDYGKLNDFDPGELRLGNSGLGMDHELFYAYLTDYMDEFRDTFDEDELFRNAGNLGRRMLLRNNAMASAGMASGVNFTGSAAAGDQNAAVQTENRKMEDNQQSQIELMQTEINLLRQLLAKDFSVNVYPSSGWGSFNDRSADRLSKVSQSV